MTLSARRRSLRILVIKSAPPTYYLLARDNPHAADPSQLEPESHAMYMLAVHRVIQLPDKLSTPRPDDLHDLFPFHYLDLSGHIYS